MIQSKEGINVEAISINKNIAHLKSYENIKLDNYKKAVSIRVKYKQKELTSKNISSKCDRSIIQNITNMSLLKINFKSLSSLH